MSALEKIMELAPRAVEEAERILNRSKSRRNRYLRRSVVSGIFWFRLPKKRICPA